MPFIRYYLGVAGLLLLSCFLIGLYIGPVSGDLTRLGYFSERDFGWRAAQPQVNIRANIADHPNVVVIGDSLSRGNIWQSHLMQTSNAFETLTFTWQALGDPRCLGAWVSSVKREYPSIRFAVVESSEREFLARFSGAQRHCESVRLTPPKVEAGLSAAQEAKPIDEVMPDPIYAFRSLLNSFRKFRDIAASGDVYIAPINRDDLFSNRRANRLLFYKEDWSDGTGDINAVKLGITNAKQLSETLQYSGVTMLLMPVPNKSAVYARYLKISAKPPLAADLWTMATAQGIPEVPLHDTFSKAVDHSVDLFLPNDTHPSTRGYMLMGDAVLAQLDAIQHAAPSSSLNTIPPAGPKVIP
jgi:hypothetical protein